VARQRPAKTSVTKFSGKRRISDEIAEHLRGQIASGEIPNGARLPAERDLAERYRVSGPTMREALQSLNTMGLLDVRHGSGTYVSTLGDTLIARALGTVIQLQRVSVQDLLGLLGTLNSYAARLAVSRSTGDDVLILEGAIAEIAAAHDMAGLEMAVKHFIIGLAGAAHDPLLIALVRFLVDIQVQLAMTAGSTFEEWRQLVTLLQPDRIAIVDALKRRDADEFTARISAFNARAFKLIDAEVQLHRSDNTQLVNILSQLSAPERR